jgi:hypothetical protein
MAGVLCRWLHILVPLPSGGEENRSQVRSNPAGSPLFILYGPETQLANFVHSFASMACWRSNPATIANKGMLGWTMDRRMCNLLCWDIGDE